MRNLLQETIEKLGEHGKTLDDIRYVGASDVRMSLANFIAISDVEYYSGFGAPDVATDLLLVGEDFWLERAEYDGSEWWEYRRMPDLSDLPIVAVDSVLGGTWSTLKDIMKVDK